MYEYECYNQNQNGQTGETANRPESGYEAAGRYPAETENLFHGDADFGAQQSGPAYGQNGFAGQNVYTGYAPGVWYTQGNADYRQPTGTQRKKRGGMFLKAAALALSCSLLGGAVGAAIAGNANKTAANVIGSGDTAIVESDRTPTVLSVERSATETPLTAAELYAANVNSTVGITTSITTNYFGYRTSAAAAGSGFIISSDGYIVTNHHVIEDSDSITVTLYNGDTYSARLIGSDPANDVAVLKISAEGLTPVTLGSAETLSVGDEVVAIGNPLGELTFSLTKGNVSALDREITLSSGTTMNLIQTDAAINSGNSGGALFNMYGEVVGITNAKYSGSSSSSEASIDNIGFAIPINTVKSIITGLIDGTYVPEAENDDGYESYYDFFPFGRGYRG